MCCGTTPPRAMWAAPRRTTPPAPPATSTRPLKASAMSTGSPCTGSTLTPPSLSPPTSQTSRASWDPCCGPRSGTPSRWSSRITWTLRSTFHPVAASWPSVTLLPGRAWPRETCLSTCGWCRLRLGLPRATSQLSHTATLPLWTWPHTSSWAWWEPLPSASRERLTSAECRMVSTTSTLFCGRCLMRTQALTWTVTWRWCAWTRPLWTRTTTPSLSPTCATQ
mmetsp:Transcript_8980/g.19238  ORF Transcript_8980/g.19238 Transcript_8980/m.19238 type:complete len:222 (+) Transcript_8980:2422-3087(+)